jgi:hypothetical protein
VADPDEFALGGPDRDCFADRDHRADPGWFAVAERNRVRPVDGNRLA